MTPPEVPALLGECAVALTASLGLCEAIRRYALRTALLDRPNERSSHRTPTPRGGGLAFVSVFTACLPLLHRAHPGSAPLWTALAGGILVAIPGWMDDRKGLSPAVRLLTQGGAALWALFALGKVHFLYMGFARVPVGSLGSLLAIVGTVWSINLFNFMDGIDGLAGGETTVAALFGAALAWGSDPATASACLLLASSVGGFLFLNRPPAKIFMGDVGSCWLGYVVAVLILASNGTCSVPMTSWFLLLSAFIVDATITLIARVVTGNSPVEPHREHAYQRLVRSGLSHGCVTGAVLAIDLLLGGTALALHRRPGLLAASVILTWTALFAVWRRTRRLPDGAAPSDPAVSSRGGAGPSRGGDR